MKYAVWLSGLVTFAEAATILNTIGTIPISASSIWRRVAVWGPKRQALDATQRAASWATPTREELNQTETPDGQDLGAAMDGGMVHIREEGWKELVRQGPGAFAMRRIRSFNPITRNYAFSSVRQPKTTWRTLDPQL